MYVCVCVVVWQLAALPLYSPYDVVAARYIADVIRCVAVVAGHVVVVIRYVAVVIRSVAVVIRHAAVGKWGLRETFPRETFPRELFLGGGWFP